jgi:hypothetical protein
MDRSVAQRREKVAPMTQTADAPLITTKRLPFQITIMIDVELALQQNSKLVGSRGVLRC